MKKAVFLLTFGILSVGAFAQNLQDNEFYRKSVELKEKARIELENGNYEQSIQYSAESAEQSRLSLEYIEKMKLIYRANSKVKMAGYRIDYAKRIKLADFDKALFDSASVGYAAATAAFEAEDYQTAIDEADKVIKKLVPECRDCLWRIAAKKEVYGDPYKWTVLWEANKETLKSNSPHLIYPGEKLYIPSIDGEKREGTL